MKNRIKFLRKKLELTQQEFADRLGVKRNTISQYETGRNKPTNGVIVLICREFNVNEEWLREGKGEMMRSLTLNEEIISFIKNVQNSPIHAFKKGFIALLTKMDDSEWDTMEKITHDIQSIVVK